MFDASKQQQMSSQNAVMLGVAYYDTTGIVIFYDGEKYRAKIDDTAKYEVSGKTIEQRICATGNEMNLKIAIQIVDEKKGWYSTTDRNTLYYETHYPEYPQEMTLLEMQCMSQLIELQKTFSLIDKSSIVNEEFSRYANGIMDILKLRMIYRMYPKFLNR